MTTTIQSTQPKILFLQFRDEPTIKEWEFDSTVVRLGVDAAQVTSFDVLTDWGELTPVVLDDYDALIVGGNGSQSVTKAEEVPFADAVKSALRAAREQQLPTFAICFGAQFTALAFGGTVERLADRAETGTFEMTVNDAGAADPLFASTPRTFMAQQGHNDSVVELPAGAVLLAGSERCPVQAFKFTDAPFYAVQYHPELDEAQLKARLEYYKEFYANDREAWQAIMDTIQPSPHAEAILKRFMSALVQTS